MSALSMTAAVAREPGADFSLETVRLDAPRPDEILVRVVGVGICHTDLSARDHRMLLLPAVLGHEGSGIVERVGADVTKVAEGDAVALSFRSCGQCRNCQAGKPSYCLQFMMLNFAGTRPDGSKAIERDGEPLSSNFFGQSSFATHALAYERNVVKLPPGVPVELMGPLGCGIQTGAGGILRSLDCAPGSSLVVLGGGSVGLSAVMAGKIRNCNPLVVVEPHASRRALALELGATHVIDPKAAPDLTAALREIAPAGLDYAFDTSGIPAVIQATAAAMGVRGQIGLVGGPPTPDGAITLPILMVMAAGLTIRGIVEGDSDPDVFIPELIEHYRAGRFPFDRLIRTYKFDQINQAIHDQHGGTVIKAVLVTG
ncbi:MAG TPA: NAD(P)-dependent alcohol dehydrogenase [Stellaceae bacterium]|nr:NAD(P)-dependent alcohol dehydrogenase [Stellaceae bacterium]